MKERPSFLFLAPRFPVAAVQPAFLFAPNETSLTKRSRKARSFDGDRLSLERLGQPDVTKPPEKGVGIGSRVRVGRKGVVDVRRGPVEDVVHSGGNRRPANGAGESI